MTKEEKSIELRPVSKEEVDRILNGEMIELSNAACGSAGGYGSCGGSAGCGGCGGCGCGSGSETILTKTGKASAPEASVYGGGFPFAASVAVEFEYQIKRETDAYGRVEYRDGKIASATFTFSFKGDSRTDGETEYIGSIKPINAKKVETVIGSGNSVSASSTTQGDTTLITKEKTTYSTTPVNAGAGLTVHFENGSVTPTCTLS